MQASIFHYGVYICSSFDLQPLQIRCGNWLLALLRAKKLTTPPKVNFYDTYRPIFLEPLTTFMGCVGKKVNVAKQCICCYFTFPGNDL